MCCLDLRLVCCRVLVYLKVCQAPWLFSAVSAVSQLCASDCRPDVLQAGESDLTTVGQLMRFVYLSNFTGHPAISIPVGLSTQGKSIHLRTKASNMWSVVIASLKMFVKHCTGCDIVNTSFLALTFSSDAAIAQYGCYMAPVKLTWLQSGA